MGDRAKETQVAIIGGGIIGTAIARELSKYKVDVCLLEKEPDLGWGITKGSQGLVHGGIAYLSSRIVKRLFENKLDLRSYLKQRLNLKEKLGFPGREMMFEIASSLNTKIIQCGRLMVAENQEELDTLKMIKEIADENKIEGIKILDRKGLEEKEPLINPKFIGGLYDPSEASAFPVEWTNAFAENAKDNGVNIMTEHDVTGIEKKHGYYLLKTSQDSIKAEYVVNAAGIYADEISAMIGRKDFSISFFHCQSLILENRNYIHHVVCRLPQPGFGRLLIPTTEGNIAVVHTIDPEKNKRNLGTTREGLESLYDRATDLIPSITPRRDIISSFVGFWSFNTKIPDDYLLEYPEKRFVNVIVCPPGIGPAPALAQKIVEMLRREGLDLIEKTDFNSYRVQEPRFITLNIEEKNKKIETDPRYGHIICRCEKVSEQEVVEAIYKGAKTLDGVKFRTRAGMGRCQGGFCTSRVLQIMARELDVSLLDLRKKGGNSYLLKCGTKDLLEARS
jgi:glycerol-3-phosphate dehydrogenase